MTTFTTFDREDEEHYLRRQIHIQQMEIDKLNFIINQLRQEKEAYYNAYAALLNHNISKNPNSRFEDEDPV
jgi:predicted methyltransferase